MTTVLAWMGTWTAVAVKLVFEPVPVPMLSGTCVGEAVPSTWRMSVSTGLRYPQVLTGRLSTLALCPSLFRRRSFLYRTMVSVRPTGKPKLGLASSWSPSSRSLAICRLSLLSALATMVTVVALLLARAWYASAASALMLATTSKTAAAVGFWKSSALKLCSYSTPPTSTARMEPGATLKGATTVDTSLALVTGGSLAIWKYCSPPWAWATTCS